MKLNLQFTHDFTFFSRSSLNVQQCPVKTIVLLLGDVTYLSFVLTSSWRAGLRGEDMEFLEYFYCKLFFPKSGHTQNHWLYRSLSLVMREKVKATRNCSTPYQEEDHSLDIIFKIAVRFSRSLMCFFFMLSRLILL